MVKRTGPTNPYLKKLIEELRGQSFKNKTPIWKDVAERLNKPRRSKIEINLSRLDGIVDDGDVVVVPGNVLGDGELNKKITVAAWRFSPSAQEKIKKSKSKIMTIDELMKENPKGSGVKILV